MAERALLAHKHEDCQYEGGQYEVCSSRWGGTNRALAAVCAGTQPTALPDVRWSPRQDAISFPVLVGTVDYLSTAVLYRVRSGKTTAYLPLWLGLPFTDARPAPDVGALVAVTSLADARAVRTRFRQFKGALADALRAGTLPAAATPVVVRAVLATLQDREWYLSPRLCSYYRL
ncbi:MAG: hypothetical protein ACI8XM_001487 [Haloarculaceae archaeon]|jgi:hypothetical protein